MAAEKEEARHEALELKSQIALKNILFATDFDVSAGRALPFAVALANRYEAVLFAAHVIPPEAYAFASPQSVDRILKEAGDFAAYTLDQIMDPFDVGACVAKRYWERGRSGRDQEFGADVMLPTWSSWARAAAPDWEKCSSVR